MPIRVGVGGFAPGAVEEYDATWLLPSRIAQSRFVLIGVASAPPAVIVNGSSWVRPLLVVILTATLPAERADAPTSKA
ncbi:hypothetical protein D3C87_1590280 [compost metagenome]